MLTRAGALIALIAATLAIVACARADGQPGGASSSYGTLVGRVTRGPMFPVSGPGAPVPDVAPVAGAELKIVDSKGAVVATVRTDAQGSYSVAMPPGQYRVEHGAGFTGATKNLPSLVSVSPGHETRLDVMVDTGIR
jgi:Carboxypeptidase regulatory-like domain